MDGRYRQIGVKQRSALTNAIKTEYTLYMGAETSGAPATGIKMYPMRKSDCSLEGTTEKIESDVKLPETRIKSTPETGSQSSSGDLSTEWNIDEQDNLIAAVLCSEWTDETTSGSVTEKKSITLGTNRNTFSALKKYNQSPVEYQWFKNLQVNQLSMDFAISSFVKLTWALMGSNQPEKVTSDPLSEYSPVYQQSLSTKSFITLDGYIKIGDTMENVSANRQISAMKISINNDMKKTDALFETEAVEMSLGDFVVSGSMDVLNSGDVARALYNDAVGGADKCIELNVSRTVASVKTSYTVQLKVHLDKVTESKDGNKLKYGIDWTMNKADGIKFVKQVETIE